jgi:hypothetical protein
MKPDQNENNKFEELFYNLDGERCFLISGGRGGGGGG